MFFLLIFLTSLLVVFFSIPPVIKVAYQKRLFDVPTESRKIHKRIIPNFGGIAIFTAFLFSSCLFIPSSTLPESNLLMAAGLILFMTGLKDDIVGLDPTAKFAAQFISAIILTVFANIRITDLQGVFGVYEMNYASSIILSVFFIVGIVNAFNLIDGIDGLAGTLGVIFSLLYAFIFFKSGDLGWAYLALSLSGALIGFLFYNITPAKIFMGDSGSLIVGFIASVLSIKFLQTESINPVQVGPVSIGFGPSLVIAILIIPIFDTLRVFTLRVLKNTSPFTADSNHLHHRLLFLGLSHLQATFMLALCNVLIIFMALSLRNLGPTQLLMAIFGTIFILNGLLSLYIESYKRSLFSRNKTVKNEDAFVLVPGPDDKKFGAEVLNKIFKN
jgi:UDP-GlcNAc:undecaprenyl-phosphate GlcNAc-1-phosphate transferase